MSWPIGYGKPSLSYRGDVDGVVVVNDVPVTAANGWFDVTLHPSAVSRGGPAEMTVRIRVGSDSDGVPFLYAEQVEIGGRRYSGVHALAVAEGTNWVVQFTRAVHDEISRRAVAKIERDPASECGRAQTRSLRAARPRIATLPPAPFSPNGASATASDGERQHDR